MKILFLGKDPKKPKAVSLRVLILIIFLFLCLNIALAYFYTEHKKNILIKAYDYNQISSHIYSNKGELDYEKNLQIYADQMGELYSRIIRIDNQTERLQKILKNQIIGKDKVPKLNEKKKKSTEEFSKDNLTNSKFKKEIIKLMAKIEVREELYNTMESILLKESVLKDTLPSIRPVNIPCCSSRYGWRIDPILGVRKFHEGIDFSAAHGEQIIATASGIVIEAGRAGYYGKHVRINHGDGFETRYAHASKLLVKKGELVSKGEVIALVGNTGRSTGPHLHYEIRLKGNSLDPLKYLKK